MIKSLIQIMIFLLCCLYIGAKIGIHSSQIRNSKSRKPYIDTSKSNVRDSVWIAKRYRRSVACDTFGTMNIELHLMDREKGLMHAFHEVDTPGIKCNYRSSFHFEFIGDSLKINLPLGTSEGEARCPLKCRTMAVLRGRMKPVYRDTLIQGINYEVLIFNGFEL